MTSKRCKVCRALLPFEHFGTTKYDPSGFNVACKECRSQYFRLQRKAKYNAKSTTDHDDSIVRSVSQQNSNILKSLINTTSEIRAFNVETKRDYKIVFGPSSISGMKSMAFFGMDGNHYREISYSGNEEDVVAPLLEFLRYYKLRLELTDVDVINSKTLIYYL